MNLAQVKKYVEGVLKGWFQNKKILDKLSVNTDGNLTFDGSEIKGGSASILEYTQGTQYAKDNLVYVDEVLARVVADYTSDNSRPALQDSFQYDIDNGALVEVSSELASCLGNVRDDNTSSFPTTATNGDWVLVEDCVNSFPGEAGIAVFDGVSWIVYKIPRPSSSFPEPSADGKNYFRTLDVGNTVGTWTLFDKVSGDEIEITLKTMNSSDVSYVPKKGELIFLQDTGKLVLGDGTSSLGLLKPFYEGTLTSADIISALGYQPEDASMKGQPNGYAPLGADGRVPNANLPASLTDTYSKSEIDNKDTTIQNAVTTLINNEAATARAAETALRTDLDAHTTNNAIHVTQTEKDTWNDKVDDADLVPFTNHISDTTIHVTQADKDKWNGMNKAVYVTDIADLPMTDNEVGNMGYVQVSDAGVTPVVCDTYIWDGTAWQLMDVDQVSLQFNWGNLIDRPTSTPLAIDNTVNVAHNHTNRLILDKIGQSATGSFTFDGIEIGVRVRFVANAAALPTEGEEETLYVVYEDSRVRGYPSISVWKDNAFQILGRGTQDTPQVVGDMSILQAEYFSVIPDSSVIINVTQNQFFAFMPLEILKETEGAKGETRVITDFTDPEDFKYDQYLINVDAIGNLKIRLEDYAATLDTVGDKYYSHVEIDLSKYKDIAGIQ